MNKSIEFFVGMDVHKDSINFAVLTETSPSPVLQVRKTNTHKAVDEILNTLYTMISENLVILTRFLTSSSL